MGKNERKRTFLLARVYGDETKDENRPPSYEELPLTSFADYAVERGR